MAKRNSSPGADLHFRLRAARRSGDVQALTAGLGDPTEGAFAARFLADIGATEAIPDIAATLNDPIPMNRSTAIESLGTLGATDWLPAVQELATDDPIPWVRAAAVEAAAKLGTIDDVRPLLHRALGDVGWQARFVAARVLQREGTPEDSDALKSASRAEVWWRRGVYRKASRAIRRRARGR